jgi:hypothetical protein
MKEKRKTDSYTRDEIYKYRERFLDFVQHFQSFWTTCEESPVKFQIDLFLNAIQPQDFRKKLTEGRSMLKTLQQVLKEFDKEASFFLAVQSTSKTSHSDSKPSNPAQGSNATPPAKPFGNSTSTSGTSGQHQGQTPASGGKKVKKLTKTKFAADDEVKVFDPGVLDSGSSVHTVPSKSYLTSSVKSVDGADGSLVAANDTEILVLGQGDSILSPNIPLSNVLITPDIVQPIVSPQLLLQDSNTSILLSSSNAYLVRDSVENTISVSNLINNSTVIATLDPADNLYKTKPVSRKNFNFNVN